MEETCLFGQSPLSKRYTTYYSRHATKDRKSENISPEAETDLIPSSHSQQDENVAEEPDSKGDGVHHHGHHHLSHVDGGLTGVIIIQILLIIVQMVTIII